MKKKWSKAELEFLKNNYSKYKLSELSILMNRSINSISKCANYRHIKLSDKELKDRFRYGAQQACIYFNGMNGYNNPNWKGGISKNNYHYKKIQQQRYPDKIKAREKLHQAVKSGKVIKKSCEVCQDQASYAHHEDYSKPYDVIWLCRKHHRERHGNLH
jgi:hypothetical protein